MGVHNIGDVIGIFTVKEIMPYRDKYRHLLYRGVCNECGFERIAKYNDLKETKKCTHIRVDGEYKSYNNCWNNKRIHKIFTGMKNRCYNKESKDYKWYGEKGIQICNEWMNNPLLFEKWALQSGYNENLTIDRIDENKDYSPNNCRWVTNKENAKYKSTTSIININGEEHTGRDWSKTLGLGVNRINTYIRQYGLDNTIEFIKRYMANPKLQGNNKSKNIYKLYMSEAFL